jgi:hypothetical protein
MFQCGPQKLCFHTGVAVKRETEREIKWFFVLPVQAGAFLRDLLVCSIFFATSGYGWLRKELIAAGI